MSKYKGFTLAELLITMFIFGVISSMTIPATLNSTNDKELKASFLKGYSSIIQAYSKTVEDNGSSIYDCYADTKYNYTLTGCKNFWANLKDNLRITKTYAGAVDGINIPNYTPIESIVTQGGLVKNPSCAGANIPNKWQKTAWYLADGSIIYSYGNKIDLYNYFILDTNGLKKPNKWGYDLFLLNFIKKTATSPLTLDDSLCGIKEKGGYWVNEMIMPQ